MKLHLVNLLFLIFFAKHTMLLIVRITFSLVFTYFHSFIVPIINKYLTNSIGNFTIIMLFPQPAVSDIYSM